MRFHPIPTFLLTALLAVLYGYAGYFIFIENIWSLEALSWSFIMLFPYTIGVITVFALKPKEDTSLVYAMFMPWVVCFGLFALAVIGTLGMLLCVVIAVPIFLPAASLGGVSMWLVRRNHKVATFLVVTAVFAPFLTSPVEAQFPIPQQTTTTHTQIRIEAEVTAVWDEIASVPAIQEEEQHFSWLHYVGLPRPVAATLSHYGVGGVRDASFENGLHFDETITEWVDHERIRFTIRETSETLLPTPLDMIDGEQFDVLEGWYEIEPQADGSVILHLTSEHYLSTRFNQYGSLWTDYIMRDLQNYILKIIKARAEQTAAQE